LLDLVLALCDGELAPAPPLLGAEVVERAGAGDLAQPRPRAASRRVEPSPRAERALERVGGKVVREVRIAGEVAEVRDDRVEMRLDRGRELLRRGRGAQPRDDVHARNTSPRRPCVTGGDAEFARVCFFATNPTCTEPCGSAARSGVRCHTGVT